LHALRFIQGDEREFKETGEQKRTALWWVITQRVAVIS